MPAETTEPADVVPRWGFGDVIIGFAAAYLLTVLLQPLVLALTGVESGADSKTWPLRTVALLQIPYDGALAATAIFATVRKGSGPVRDLRARMRWPDMPIGLAIGVA